MRIWWLEDFENARVGPPAFAAPPNTARANAQTTTGGPKPRTARTSIRPCPKGDRVTRFLLRSRHAQRTYALGP